MHNGNKSYAAIPTPAIVGRSATWDNMGDKSRRPGELHGRTGARCTAGGFIITDGFYPPSLRIRRHDHELASLCIVMSGGYDEDYGNRCRRAEPGTAIVHPAGEHHANRHDPAPGRVLTIEVEHGRLDLLRQEFPIMDESWHGEDRGLTVIARRIAAEARQAGHGALTAVESLVLELLARVHPVQRPAARGAQWLARVRDELEAFPGRPPPLGQLALLAGVHPVHLARAFRAAFGCSVGCYSRRLQVARAVILLDDPDLSLSAIALEAGFADQSHMTRLVRAQTGLPPGAWRRLRDEPA